MNEEEYEDEDTDYFLDNPEYLCVNCGTREAILNHCCAMCCELRPDLMGLPA